MNAVQMHNHPSCKNVLKEKLEQLNLRKSVQIQDVWIKYSIIHLKTVCRAEIPRMHSFYKILELEMARLRSLAIFEFRDRWETVS